MCLSEQKLYFAITTLLKLMILYIIICFCSFDTRPQKQPLRLSTIDEANRDRVGLELEYLLKRACDRSQDSGAPLSPTTSEAAVTSTASTTSSSRVMSSAISNESVAGDSGVFEASTSPSKNAGEADKLTSLMAAMSFEAAQVQVKMRYDREDSLLHIGVERARNLRTLVLKPKRLL